MSEFEKSRFVVATSGHRDLSFAAAADLFPPSRLPRGLVTVKPPSGFRVLARARGGGNPLGKGTRGAQAASATPSMLNASDAFPTE